METIKAGRPLIDLVKLCCRADRPLLLNGRHGVGKSEMLEQAARELGIGFVCRDLSLMEPPDLVGLPVREHKNTVYAPPQFLPQKGSGLLVFEELNRCEPYMRAPCLQLLTARQLNDYRLPAGWLPVAAINPPDDDYEVNELDPALRSRFIEVRIEPDRHEWLVWARQHNLHPAVISYVESDPTVFDAPTSNPRAWTDVSRVFQAADKDGTAKATRRAAVLGLVGDRRGAAFLASLKQRTDEPLIAEEVLRQYERKHRTRIERWIRTCHLELAEATMTTVLIHLQPQADYDAVRSSRVQWRNLALFLHDLPGDLHEQAKQRFKERNYPFPRRPRSHAHAA